MKHSPPQEPCKTKEWGAGDLLHATRFSKQSFTPNQASKASYIAITNYNYSKTNSSTTLLFDLELAALRHQRTADISEFEV